MLSFDLGKKEFTELVSGIEKPVLVQLFAKIDPESIDSGKASSEMVDSGSIDSGNLDNRSVSGFSPLQLYRSLRKAGNANYSYLLESVEKQETKARYSFVGSSPDALISINDRKISLKLLDPKACGFFQYLCSRIEKRCAIETQNPEMGMIIAEIPEGKDAFDAMRFVFPGTEKMKLLNAKRFDRQTFLGGAIGYTAYDAIYDSLLGVKKGFESEFPELEYLLVSKSFVFDHLTEEIYIVLTPFLSPDLDPGTIYDEALEEAQRLFSELKKASESEEFESISENSGNPQNLVSQAVDSTITSSSEASSSEASSPAASSPAVRSPATSLLDNSSSSSLSSTSSGFSTFVSAQEKSAFKEIVLSAKEHIYAGDIFQVVPSRKREFELQQSPFELYKQLRAINPSPYMYLFEFGDLAIVGASPETLLTVHRRNVSINPIAGTCPRGKSCAEDEAFASHMLQDKKERAEHVMLVDLGRNDVRMVSKSGSVKVSGFMQVLKYSHVQHIESTVSGTLRPECDQFDAFRAIFPAGTLSGAPKIRAMEIIAELEQTPRGIYGGGVGYYSWNGDADFAIVIRTVIVKGRKASIQAGGGIVADSDPEYEFRETERKMAAILSAIEKLNEVSKERVSEGGLTGERTSEEGLTEERTSEKRGLEESI
jgi:anthranilate synthase component 1